MNVWPDDNFDHTPTTLWGTYLIGWAGVTGTTSWGTAGNLSSHAFQLLGITSAQAIGALVDEGKRHGWVRRETVPETVGGGLGGVTVTAYHAYAIQDGSAPSTNFGADDAITGGFGVIARCTGGTWTAPSDTDTTSKAIYWANADFYAAVVVGNGDGTVTYKLLRYVSGTETELASTTLTPLDNTAWTTPAGMRLYVVNEVGTVDPILTLWVKDIGFAPAPAQSTPGPSAKGAPWASERVGARTPGDMQQIIDGDDDWQQILTHTDTDAAAISALGGRPGVIIPIEDQVTVDAQAHDLVFYSTLFEVHDGQSTDPVYMRDEWARAFVVGEPLTDRWGTNGVITQSDLAFDHFSHLFDRVIDTPYTGGVTTNPANGYQGFPWKKATSSGTDGIQLDEPINSPAQEMIALSARDTPVNSLDLVCEANYVFAVTNESDLRIGVLCRGIQGGTDGNVGGIGGNDTFIGYTFEISSDGTARIRRRVAASQGTSEVLAEKTSAITPDTSEHKIRGACWEEAGPDPPGQNPVLLELYIDDAQVVLELPASPSSGVSVDANGRVRDANDGRLSATPRVGMAATFPATDGVTTHTIVVERFRLRTDLTNIITGLGDLPSVVFDAENANKTGTLTSPVDWGYDVEAVIPSSQRRMAGGYTVGRVYDDQPRQKWRLSGIMTTAERDTARTFYDDHDGGEIPFDWTDPDGDAYEVKFVPGSWRDRMIGTAEYAVSYEVEEVFANAV